jgi:protein SCO1
MRWILLFLLFTMLAGCGTAAKPPATRAVTTEAQPGATNTPTTDGIIFRDPPETVLDFTLTDQQGAARSLSDFNGKLTLLSFGYTHCPDICPLTLAHFKRVKELLGEESTNVQFVFISVDGARDTPERLNEYLAMFDEGFIGLTGEEPMLHEIIGRYGGTFLLENAGGFRENYPVQHTAGSFLMDKNGKWIRQYVYETEPAAIAADIQDILRG